MTITDKIQNGNKESQFFDPLKMADVIIMNGIKNVIEIK
jgi:hypothetical protein